MPTVHPRRSALYVPGSNERALAKALHLRADVLLIDLEDSVAPSAKEAARARVAALLLQWCGEVVRPEIVVRVNGLDTPWVTEDLAAILPVAPDALLLPKISGAADLQRFRAAIHASAQALPAGSLELWAMIETPRAVLEPLDIALAGDDRLPLAAFVLGLNDLARETRTRQVPGRGPMLPWMMNALAAARVGGLDILDGVFNDIGDPAGFAAECDAARDQGFDGKTVIHPAQIDPCNERFSPSAEEIAAAMQIAAIFDQPGNADRGVVRVDGRMVERLHAEMARRTLALAKAIRR